MQNGSIIWIIFISIW